MFFEQLMLDERMAPGRGVALGCLVQERVSVSRESVGSMDEAHDGVDGWVERSGFDVVYLDANRFV